MLMKKVLFSDKIYLRGKSLKRILLEQVSNLFMDENTSFHGDLLLLRWGREVREESWGRLCVAAAAG